MFLNKKYVTCIVLVCSALIMNAQHAKKVTWSGTLISTNKQIYPIKVELKRSGDDITGFTLNHAGDFFSKTSIEGKVLKNDQLYFSEKSILEISDSTVLDQMCLLTFTSDYQEELNKKNILRGKYVGKYADGSPCDSGTFIFTDAYIPKVLLRKLAVAAENSDLGSGGNQSFDTNGILEKNEISLIESALPVNYLALKEAGSIDNDSIQIIDLKAGTDTRICLDTKPYNYLVELKKGEIKKIAVIALNIGDRPPNTSKAKVYNEDKVLKDFTLNLNKRDTTYIYFMRK